MIHRINIFLICLFVAINPVFLIKSANASAAEELWKYEPTLKDMKVNVTAHKVDHLGNAVNDNTYKTQIDPKTATNKTAQGRVGMNRLLRVSGWGLVGAAALQGLLEAVDWVIDPESQSIWRNKSSNDPQYNCFKTYTGEDGKSYKYKYPAPENQLYDCPDQAAEHIMRYYEKSQPSLKKDQFKFARWQDNPDFSTTVLFFATYQFIPEVQNGSRTKEIQHSLNSIKSKELAPDSNDKEYLTPDELSDYINKTHTDYADPQLAPKLEPKYKPNEIIPPLWTPQNDYEYENSPTVDIIKKDLDKQNPTSPDKDIEPNPDTGGMSLPNFCDWAKVVCDFVKDFNKEPDLKDRDNTVQIDELPITPPVTNYFSWNAYCPFQNQSSQISINDQTTSVDSDLSSWCTMASEVKPFVIAAGSIASLMIISGVGIKED